MARRGIDLGGDDWRFGSVSLKPLEALTDDRDEVEEWLPATVPGNVRADLLALGRIEDPFYGTNNERSQWVDGRDWWYARPLNIELREGERALLCFDGIDYISAVYLDHTELGSHEGMFSQQIYEVTGLPGAEGSQLAVRICGSDSLPRRTLSWWEKLWSPLATALQRGEDAFPDRTATLKCQMSFGWDFAPRIRTMGVWDEVSLILCRSVFVSDVFINARPERGAAVVSVKATLDSDRAQEVVAQIEIAEGGRPDQKVGRWEFRLALDQGKQVRDVEFTLARPRLWQPWDRGESHLYDLRLRVRRGEQTLDSVKESFGVRSVEMVPNPETPAGHEAWTLVLNGARQFIRGANWVPPDALPGRVSSGDYAQLVDMAKKAGINLLRVWGGGLREKRAFYDLCDREGIMVWQEFPLACLMLGHLPRQRTFLHLLRQEATSIVRQLRNHPSLIMWCGGNEFSYRRNQEVVDTLGATVAEENGNRPFRKSSPGRGARHNWLVWHGKAPLRDYRKDQAQFASEFGLQSVPDVSSLSRFLPQADLYPPGEGWRYHCAQLEKLERYVRPFYPDSLEQWIQASQKVQAYGLQIAIEHFRRRKYRTSGTIVWQLNDPWPNISWSLIDHYRVPKLAYVKLRALYNPVLISLEYPLRRYKAGDLFRARIWAINDLVTSYDDCRLDLTLDDNSVFSSLVSLPADSCRPIGWVERRLAGRPDALIVTLRHGEDLISRNQYDLTYHDPQEARFLDTLCTRLSQWAVE